MKKSDAYTENVLVMELATMVVAIALAFLATSLTGYSFTAIQGIVEFVIVSTVVLWFWWSYVVERLEYPFKTLKFPIYDVLILITISLIPFSYRIGGIIYISGLLSFLMFFWALMLLEIIQENKDIMNDTDKKLMKFEIRLRIIISIIAAITVVIGLFSNLYAIISFAFTVLMIIIGYIRKMEFKAKS